MADNININVTENIDQVNIVASEIVEVVDLNLYATTEDVSINVTEEIIQVNINKVEASNITKTSDLINDGEDGINPFITLEDIPPIDVSTLVPYTGATQDVDLGEFELKAGQVEFDTTPTGTAGVGVMRWNDSDGTLDLGLKGGNVTLQLGQEQLVRAVNKTSTNITLLESNYQAVRVTGAQGQRLKVDLALATNDLLSAETIGLVTETIANNQEGFITISGLVRNINTTGSLQGETWNDGDILYLSPTTAGKITNIKPTAPNHLVIIGYVVYAHANNGKIFVKVNNGYELEELHNVTSTNYTTPIDSDSVLTFDITNSLWKRLSWSNIKSNLKTYFDTIYTTTSAVATQISTALVGYATESFVTSQGYITNVTTALGFTPENVANKSTSTSLGTSNTLYPTQNAVKVYADTKVDKVTTSGVERVYTINADGSQGVKATSNLGEMVIRAYYPSWNFTTLNTWRSWNRNTSNMLAVDANQSLGTGTTPNSFVDSNFILVTNKTRLKKVYWSMREGLISQTVEFFIRSFTFENGTPRGSETNIQTLIQESFTLPISSRNGYKDNFVIANHTLTPVTGFFISFRQTSGVSTTTLQGVQLILEFE
jgi:hypothetical protein